MAKTWVLETHTKGTGANVVALEDGAPAAAEPAEREPLFVARKPVPKAPAAPVPKPPSRFKVVEITTGRVLAEDAGVRATVELLRDEVASITDVAIWIWREPQGRYVLLTHGEQRRLWELRARAAAPPAPPPPPPPRRPRRGALLRDPRRPRRRAGLGRGDAVLVALDA